jgi:hypothetical protein
MSVDSPRCPYILVVDTDKYAGNFERELTGFCVGVHDGTHGDREAADFGEWLEEQDKTSGWEAISTTEPEDNGWPRVCTIWPTPGRLNNGMGYHYDANAGGEEEARAKSIQAMRDYHAGQMEMCQRRLDTGDFEEDNGGRGWTKEGCERTIASALASIERAGQFVSFPAYESVAIFLTKRPSAADMKIFLERLRDFAQNMTWCGKRTDKPLTIKGVRLVKRETVVTETVVEEFVFVPPN